jgi:hypothetical protein
MKYNVDNYSDVVVESTTQEKDFRISKDSQSIFFQMFSKNIYSNPIGSIVREITSNCFDSHVEANVNLPIIIRKSVDKDNNATNISFIDFGVGISVERMDETFSVFLNSTKRSDNQQIGGFGLGSKSPLAYKRSTGFGDGEYDNSYSIITVFDKIKYEYLIYEGNKCPKYSLLNSEPTDQGNGTEVRIPVLQKDINTFENEMFRQLYYFENIIFEGFEESRYNLAKEYQIIRGKNFVFRGDNYSMYVHVCLGRVAYPIDYDVLRLNSSDYNLPIAIKLNVGDINVTANREQLDYSENTISILKKKLAEAKAEVIAMLVKQYESVVTLEDYFSTKNKFGVVNFPNGSTMYIGNVIKFGDIDFNKFKYGFMKMPNDRELFNFFVSKRLYGKKENQRRSRYANQNSKVFSGSYDEIVAANNVYYFENNFDRKLVKQAWLKSKHERYYMLSKKDIINRSSIYDVSDLFRVSDDIIDADGQPTKYALSLLDLQNEYFEIIKKHCNDYNMLQVPEDFIVTRKRTGLTDDVKNNSISVKIANHYSKYKVKLDSLLKLKCPIFYGTTDNESEVDRVSNLFDILFNSDYNINGYNEYDHMFRSGKQQILFIIIAKNNIKYMQHCHNAMPVSMFRHKLLYRKENDIIKFFESFKVIDKYNGLKAIYTSKEFARLSADWTNRIDIVKQYINSAATINSKYRELVRYKSMLSIYFPINEIKDSKKVTECIDIINEGLYMQEMNDDVLKCINMPHSLEYATDTMWKILEKVLVY